MLIVPTLLRGNASTDALRSALDGTRSVPGCILTRSMGTITRHPLSEMAGFVVSALAHQTVSTFSEWSLSMPVMMVAVS